MFANMHNDYADRKNGRQAITYQHDDLEALLGDTQGLMIYQESVMRVAQKFAGYSLEEADNLRKACGKKIRELIAAEREKFVSGCVSQGYGEELGTELFDIIEPFADYAFNKSHSYGYGLVAYQTAWLKAHYPVEYMAALLTTVRDDKDKTAVYLSECRSMGIEVVVPDVNRSLGDFAPRVDETSSLRGISFGMAAVRNVGEALVERIVNEREANGLFTDFYDFCRRVDTMVLNRRTIESLIKAGAFDSLGHPRQGLALVADEIIERTIERRKERDLGISTLFASAAQEAGDDDADWEGTSLAIPDREFDKSTKLAFEKEMLGLYVSDHPLMGLERALARHTDATIADCKEIAEGSANGANAEAVVRQVGGVVTELKTNYTKKGEFMARFMLEDLQGSMEVFVFPKAMTDYGSLLENDAIVVVRGRVDIRDEMPKITTLQISRPVIDANSSSELRLNLPLEALSDSTVNELKGILQEHPGEAPVFIHMGEKILRLPPEFNVNPNNVVGEIRRLLGANAILAA
jgi:DNA polymerase-3 subunit alpha